MSSGSGALPGSAAPTAWAIRPQFGSPPCSAAFTSGESATARATRAATALGAAADHHAADAAGALAVARRSAARAAAAARRAPRRRRSSSSDSGATRTPLAPDAISSAVSFVESWPSTEMRSNERLTQTPSSRSAVCGSSAASVCTKQSIVANAGEIIPAPLAWALSRTLPDGSRPRARRCLANLSVVRIASPNVASPSAASSRRASAMPADRPCRCPAARRSRRSTRPRRGPRTRRRPSPPRPACAPRPRARGGPWPRSRCRSWRPRHGCRRAGSAPASAGPARRARPSA